MKKLGKIVSLLLMGSMICSLCACGGKGGNQVVFGTNAEFPPFEYTSDGVNFDGIDMAIANQICAENGKTAVINNMEFDSLLIALQRKNLVSFHFSVHRRQIMRIFGCGRRNVWRCLCLSI